MATIIPGRVMSSAEAGGYGCTPLADPTGTAPRRRPVDTSAMEAAFAEFNAGVERARNAARREAKP